MFTQAYGNKNYRRRLTGSLMLGYVDTDTLKYYYQAWRYKDMGAAEKM